MVEGHGRAAAIHQGPPAMPRAGRVLATSHQRQTDEPTYISYSSQRRRRTAVSLWAPGEYCAQIAPGVDPEPSGRLGAW